tara:strand:- start:221 stop:2167 length:1947 start_codon:yes stop_codon:yes gene_type:complete
MSNNKDFKVKNGIQPTVYNEGVGTVVSDTTGYDLAGASYDGVSFSVAVAQVPNPVNNTFSSDGTKMYVIDGQYGIFQYNMSTAWDLSTASYASKSFLPTAQITSGYNYGITFKSDGTKVYLGDLVNDVIYQYSLSTAWDISTASYDSISLNVTSQASNPYGLFLSPDNTELYIADIGNDRVVQYTLSTAGDLSSAGHTGNFSVASQDANPRAVYLKSDGTKAFIIGNDNSSVFSYTLSTAWDITSATYDSVSFSTLSQEADIRGLYFSDTGHRMFVLGYDPDTIYQYSTVLTTNTADLSSGSVFEITPTSDFEFGLSNPADSGTVSGATLLLDGGVASSYDIANAVYTSKSINVNSQDANPQNVFLKPDGNTLYLVGSANDSIYQYSLSVSGDLSTASYDSVSFSVSGQETTPQGLFFKPDGTKMYVSGSVADAVHQYTLSTAWDISTASYDSVSFSLSGQITANNAIYFKDDGTVFYASNGADDTIYQYALSTAWDISTASYAAKSFSTASQDSASYGVTLDSTGTKLFVIGLTTTPRVMQYTLSTAWDISTASYDSLTFSISEDSGPLKAVFDSSGETMYIVGSTNDTIYQYSTATPATITYASNIEWPSGTAPTSPAIGETDVITFNTRDGGTTYSGVLAIDGAK